MACDIPAPCFSFLFEDNPNWSKYYADGKEIHEYIQSVATKYRLQEYVKCSHWVELATWKEDSGTWVLQIHDTINDTVRPQIFVH